MKLGCKLQTGKSGCASLNKRNGEDPIFKSIHGIMTPKIMEVKKVCTKAKTVITGDSHLGFLIIKITPKIACQKIQSKNEPSCPSQ